MDLAKASRCAILLKFYFILNNVLNTLFGVLLTVANTYAASVRTIVMAQESSIYSLTRTISSIPVDTTHLYDFGILGNLAQNGKTFCLSFSCF